MIFEAYQISFIIGIALVGLELMTGTFVLLGLGIAFMVVAIVQYLFIFSLERDMLLLVLCAISFIVTLRWFFPITNHNKESKNDVNKY